jgi:hypothetical protein
MEMGQVGTLWELAMTTKELCDALRHTHPSRIMCKEAADVIERLTKRVEALEEAIEFIVEQDKELEKSR